MALNAFRQTKAESLADFGRKDIGLADVALGHRRSLGELTGQRQQLALAPSDTRFSTSTQYQNLGVSYENFEHLLQTDRLAQYGSQRDSALAQYQADQARMAAIAGGFASLGDRGGQGATGLADASLAAKGRTMGSAAGYR